jgi:Lon protease-like protein
MSASTELDAELKDFSGMAPLFPLPNVVLFPQALLPLHIFEPRYRKMTADALEGERLIAMSLLRPGWEHLPSTTNPPIHKIVGLGKIIAHEKLDDGRYYLVLRGLARAKLIGEQQVDLPYRVGQLELCREIVSDQPEFNRQDRAEELADLFGKLFPEVTLQKLFLNAISDLPLGTVCDLLLGSLSLPSEMSQHFQNELNVDVRSQKLLALLKNTVKGSKTDSKQKFPPKFSEN